MGKIDSEKKVVEKMIRMYCRKMHAQNNLCESCNALTQYALERLDKCPFKDSKPACKVCKIHCYNNEMRQKIREVMRFSGPRILFSYPKDFLLHLLGK
jgi:hypothetical protein